MNPVLQSSAELLGSCIGMLSPDTLASIGTRPTMATVTCMCKLVIVDVGNGDGRLLGIRADSKKFVEMSEVDGVCVFKEFTDVVAAVDAGWSEPIRYIENLHTLLVQRFGEIKAKAEVTPPRLLAEVLPFGRKNEKHR